jgi:site-specific recombinase XerD
MLPWLSAYLGHRNLLGTEHYLHATPELLAVAAGVACNDNSGRLRHHEGRRSRVRPGAVVLLRPSAKVRGASPHTVAAYRDALRLFLQFTADRRGIPVSRLQISDLHAETVAAFLLHLEQQRHNPTATRNCRRIALRGFFQHALRQDPERANQYARVLALPAKRYARPLPRSLEPSQMRQLLAQPDRRIPGGQRDYTLLLFLYNTGARISEAVAVCRKDLQITPPYHVRLQGKGGKARFCPLWPTTMAALNSLLIDRPDPAEPLFRSCRRTPLTRPGLNTSSKSTPPPHRASIRPSLHESHPTSSVTVVPVRFCRAVSI